MSRMFHSRLAMIFVAALLAVFAASAVALYVSRAKTEAQKSNADATVVVAAIEGAVVLSKARRHSAPLHAVRGALPALLGSTP